MPCIQHAYYMYIYYMYILYVYVYIYIYINLSLILFLAPSLDITERVARNGKCTGCARLRHVHQRGSHRLSFILLAFQSLFITQLFIFRFQTCASFLYSTSFLLHFSWWTSSGHLLFLWMVIIERIAWGWRQDQGWDRQCRGKRGQKEGSWYYWWGEGGAGQEELKKQE